MAKKKGKETAWDKDPRYKDHVLRATTFRLVLDGDRETYLKLRNTFNWYRWMLRMMDFYLSSAESAFSVLDAGQVKVALGEKTPEKKTKKKTTKKKAKKSKVSEEVKAELGFRLKVYNTAAKVAERARQGVNSEAALDTLYYEMRELFFKENEKAVREGGCLPLASYVWDAARSELTSIRDKILPGFGGAKRSWMVTRGVLGNIEAQNARIPFLRTYKDHCAEFGDKNWKTARSCDPFVKFVESNDEQYVSLRVSRRPDVRLKLIVTGAVKNPDGTEWTKTPPASVRNLFHRFATGGFPATTSYLQLDRKGRLSLLVTHRKPLKKGLSVEREGKLEVIFSRIHGNELAPPKGKKQVEALKEVERVKDMIYVVHLMHEAKTGRRYVERIAVNSTLTQLKTFDKLRLAKEFERDSQRYFPPRRRAKLDRSIRGYTRQREALQTAVNHAWTKSVIHKAIKWRCGTIVVYNLPKNTGLLLTEAHPWRWSQFGSELEAKAEYYGLKLESREEVDMKPLYAVLREAVHNNGKEKTVGKEKEPAGAASAAV